MKLLALPFILTLALTEATPANIERRDTVQGFDISHYQTTVNFQGAYNSGARFVIIKVSIQVQLPYPRTSSLSIIKTPKSKLTSPPPTGNRRHNLHRLFLLLPLHRRYLRRSHPWRLPLRPPGQQLWRYASEVLPGSRRRLVKRWYHPSRHAGHRV